MMSRLHAYDDLREGGALADRARVDLLHGPRLGAVDEDAVDEVEELVTGRALTRPRSGMRSPGARIFSATT